MDVFAKKKQKNRKQIVFYFQRNDLHWFCSFPITGIFVQRDWHSSRRMPPWKWKLYKIVYKEKTAMCNNPIEFQFIYFPYVLERLITLLLVQSWLDWLVLSSIVYTEVWLQSDPMRHSVTLGSLIFAWTSLSGFQSTEIPFFAQAAFSGFRLTGCTNFFFISSLILPEPFWFAGKP